MIISNLSVPLVGAVDTAVVGRLPSPAHIGAVALGALMFTFLYWAFGFLRMGTTGFVARAFGAHDRDAIAATMLRSLLLALLFGFVVILIGAPAIALALHWIDTSVAVEQLAAQYARIRLWSAPATLCVYVFTGVFIGMHNTRRALYLVLTLNCTNIALDFLFVIGFQLGVSGVAWATLIAEYTAALLGVWLLRAQFIDALRRIPLRRALDRAALMQLLRANGHLFVRTLCLMFSFAWFTAQGARFGEVILAANAVLMHLHHFTAYALDGFAHAAEALMGGAFGARNRRAFDRTARLTTVCAAVTALLITALYALFGAHLLRLFTDIDAVLIAAEQHLIWVIVLPLLSVWSFQLDGIFIGGGHTRAMRNAMLWSTAMYLIALVFLMPRFGNHGLFMGLCIFMAVRALTLWRHYPRLRAAVEE